MAMYIKYKILLFIPSRRGGGGLYATKNPCAVYIIFYILSYYDYYDVNILQQKVHRWSVDTMVIDNIVRVLYDVGL